MFSELSLGFGGSRLSRASGEIGAERRVTFEIHRQPHFQHRSFLREAVRIENDVHEVLVGEGMLTCLLPRHLV